MFHVNSSSIIPPPLEAIGGVIKNFGVEVEEDGDGEGDAEAREVQEVAPRKPRRTPKSKPPSKAARLPHFAQAWHQVTSNNFILNIICNGYKIQFTSTPIQNNYQPRIMSKSNNLICKDKVSEFLKFKIIKVVSPSHDQFVSHIFPVPKKSLGEFRIILDLSDLNFFVQKIRFRMDSLSDIINLIQPGDYFISIDISDAYFCIAIHILSMPYLTFIFLNVYYQFTCLPQSLSSAPRIFTKIIRIVLTFLRCQNIRIAAWGHMINSVNFLR